MQGLLLHLQLLLGLHGALLGLELLPLRLLHLHRLLLLQLLGLLQPLRLLLLGLLDLLRLCRLGRLCRLDLRRALLQLQLLLLLKLRRLLEGRRRLQLLGLLQLLELPQLQRGLWRRRRAGAADAAMAPLAGRHRRAHADRHARQLAGRQPDLVAPADRAAAEVVGGHHGDRAGQAVWLAKPPWRAASCRWKAARLASST